MKAITVLLLVPTIAIAQEESITAANIPAPVKSAVMARFAGAKIKGGSKETEDGKTFYEVSLDRAGKNIDVTSTPAGVLTLIESEISRADLPAAVTTLIDTKYAKATWQRVEEVREIKNKVEKVSFYEVLLVDAKKQGWELQVAVDGSKFINVEKKKAGEPD